MKPHRWPRICLSLIALPLLSLVAVGCGSGSAVTSTAVAAGATSGQIAPASAKPQQVSILLNWFADVERGGYVNMALPGEGTKYGLDVKVIPGSPSVQTIPQVASGQAQFGVAQADQILQARAKGVPVVQIFGGWNRFPTCLMWHSNQHISGFADMNGRTLAVDLAGAYWLYLKWRYHLNNVKVIPYQGLAVFKQQQTLVHQCFIEAEPWQENHELGVPTDALLVSSTGYDPYANGLFTTETMIKEHPDLVKKVVAAAQNGWSTFLANPAPVRADVAKLTKDTDLKQFDHTIDLLRQPGWFADPLGAMTKARWNTLAAQLKAAGVIPSTLDPSAAWTDQFIPTH